MERRRDEWKGEGINGKENGRMGMRMEECKGEWKDGKEKG